MRIERFKHFEAAGVPSGLVDMATRLYAAIAEGIKSGEAEFAKEKVDPAEYKYPTEKAHFIIGVPAEKLGESRINDYEIKEISVVVSSDYVDFPEELREKKPLDRFGGAGYGPNQHIDRKNFKTVFNDGGEVNIQVKLIFQNEGEMDEKKWRDIVCETLSATRTRIISTLGHELMHSYDVGYIKGSEGHRETSKYNSYNIRTGNKAIDDFIYYLYYTTRCESMVRNTEVASAMDAQGIDQQRFSEYLSSNETFKHLKTIREWTYKGLRSKIMEDIDEIRKSFPEGAKEMSDEEVVTTLLQNVIHGLNTATLDSLIDMIKTPSIFGMSLIDPEDDATEEEKMAFMKSFAKELRTDVLNPDRYFEKKERYFRETAEKLIKKLGKLYSLAKPSAPNPIHSKINARIKKESRIFSWESFWKKK